MNGLDACVDELLAETTEGIGDCLAHFWPCRANGGTGNALHEDNILLHFGVACRRRHWVVYPQAARHGEPGWLDMLAYNPADGLQIRVEAKRFIKAGSDDAVLDDIAKIDRFVPNHPDNTGQPILRPRRCLGLILCITHEERRMRHWEDRATGRRKLARHFRDRCLQAGVHAIHADDKPDIWPTWLLYAVHEVRRVAVNAGS